MSGTQSILFVIHPSREAASRFAAELQRELVAAGCQIFTNNAELLPGAKNHEQDLHYDLVVVLGGDGTILRAAELLGNHHTPILGINMGNVGFLAQVTQPTLQDLTSAIIHRRFHFEPRLTVTYSIYRNGELLTQGWALNEASIERGTNQMVELFVQIDGRPLSRWGCDGVICATPTGSTAYAFSAGGPVVWPEVDALVLLPLAAHALFSRPMVISPDSKIVIEIESATAELSADGMRRTQLLQGDRIELTRSPEKVSLVYIQDGVFTDRLVAKFKLPVEGWRGETQ
jgi:NAD+ kinase